MEYPYLRIEKILFLLKIFRKRQDIMKIPEENCLEKRHAKTKDIALFRELFDSYFRTLTTYAYRFVCDWQTAEDITQDVFTSLWERRKTSTSTIQSSPTFTVPFTTVPSIT